MKIIYWTSWAKHLSILAVSLNFKRSKLLDSLDTEASLWTALLWLGVLAECSWEETGSDPGETSKILLMTTPDIEAIISKEQNLNMMLKCKQLHKKGPSNGLKKPTLWTCMNNKKQPRLRCYPRCHTNTIQSSVRSLLSYVNIHLTIKTTWLLCLSPRSMSWTKPCLPCVQEPWLSDGPSVQFPIAGRGWMLRGNIIPRGCCHDLQGKSLLLNPGPTVIFIYSKYGDLSKCVNI